MADQIEEKKNKSELAAYIWKLKEQKKTFKVSWSIVKRAWPYNPGSKQCDLCACEKTFISMGTQPAPSTAEVKFSTNAEAEQNSYLKAFCPLKNIRGLPKWFFF